MTADVRSALISPDLWIQEFKYTGSLGPHISLLCQVAPENRTRLMAPGLNPPHGAPRCSVCGPRACNTQELGKNAESQAPAQTCRARICILHKIPGHFEGSVKCEEH